MDDPTAPSPERARLERLFLEAPVPIAVQAGPEHVYLLANARYRAFVGGLDITGLRRRDVLSDQATLSGILDRVLASGEAYIGQEDLLRVWRDPGGPLEEAFFNFICQPTFDDAGRPSGVITFAVEVTETVLARRSSERLAADLRAAVEARDQFLSVASHELRTPLTSLVLQAQRLGTLLAHDPLPRDRMERAVEVLSRQLDRLTRLVEDLLEVSRLAEGRLPLAFEELDLSTLVEEVASQFEELSRRAGSLITVRFDVPVHGRWDRLRLEQVVANLLSNAIKYGVGAPIEVRVTQVAAVAIVEVCDRGIGIDPEHHGRIFERFGRAVSERNYGGLGLGLWISRQLVEAMGGRIEVVSETGQGALFRVELPIS